MILDARTAPIHHALEDYLTHKNLAYALRLWSEKFIVQANISLKAYIDSFHHKQPMTLRSHELYNHLLPAMLKACKVRDRFAGELIEPYEFHDYDLDESKSSSRKALPATEKAVSTPIVIIDSIQKVVIEKEASNEQGVIAPRIEQYEIYSLFIRTLCSRIPDDSLQKLLSACEPDIKKCCFFHLGDDFFEWLSSDSDYFYDEGLIPDNMSHITNIIYMGMCDYLGPIKADNILNYSANFVAMEHLNSDFSLDQIL